MYWNLWSEKEASFPTQLIGREKLLGEVPKLKYFFISPLEKLHGLNTSSFLDCFFFRLWYLKVS